MNIVYKHLSIYLYLSSLCVYKHTAEDVAGVEVVRFQPDGAAVSDSLGLYRGTLSSSKTMSSVTLCARFNMFFLHSRACFFMLEDTIAGKDNMLKGGTSLRIHVWNQSHFQENGFVIQLHCLLICVPYQMIYMP